MMVELLAAHVELVKNKTCVDLGCGTGVRKDKGRFPRDP